MAPKPPPNPAPGPPGRQTNDFAFLSAIYGPTNSAAYSIPTSLLLFAFPMVDAVTGAPYICAFDPTQGYNDPRDGSQHYFRVEELAPYRTPTVRRVIITYRDMGPCQVTITLNGTNDKQEQVSVSVTVPFGSENPSFTLKTIAADLQLTAMNIQCVISREADGGQVSIAKLTLIGEVEEQTL